MGKGQRARQARAGLKEEKKKIAAKQKLNQKIKKVIGVSAASLIALALVVVIAFSFISSTGFFLRNTVAMKTDNYSVDNAMMTYYVKNQYFNFANQNADYLSMFGLDTSKSLSSQKYGEQTWLEYFLDQAKEQVNDMLIFAEKAKADGIVLDDADKAKIDETFANFKTEAESQKWTLAQYYTNAFGEGIKESDIRRAMELSTLASKYYEKYEATISYTEEDYQKHFKDNESDYIKADYISISIPGGTEAEKKTNAKIFQDCKTVEDFTKLVENLLRSQETKDYLESNSITSEADLTDKQKEEIAQNIATALEAASATANKPAPDAESTSEFNKWLFQSARKVGDVYTAETAADAEKKTEFSMTVYMVKKTAYSDDYKLMKARHIMFTAEKYETDEAAKAKAEEVLKLYQATPTVENFTTLAKEYSEDATTSEKGGLYEQITNDVNAWPFSEWVYANGRKIGDVEIVKTSLGYHVMYFEGEGDVAWKASAKTAMLNEDYEAHVEELGKTYVVTKFDNKMKNIKG